jgi:hypothetical protein
MERLIYQQEDSVSVVKTAQQTQAIRVQNLEGLCTQKGVIKQMNIHRSLFGIACRAAAFSFLMAGTALLAQTTSAASAVKAPVLLASESASADLALASSSSSSSTDADAAADSSSGARFNLLGSTQPPPRRRYGRPNYSSGNTNKDGSEKYTFLGGMGMTSPIGNTHKYETPSYGFQFGGGRNFNKVAGLLLQFDYDHFGLQGATLANQTYVYDYCTQADITAGYCTQQGAYKLNNVTQGQLDGNNHVWSFTLNPTFTLPTEGSLGAYAVLGGGFYHKVTNFTVPTVGEYCDYYYGCYEYSANQVIDHYSSNAVGVNGGIGLTYKISKFSNERFYVEARYVFIPNSQRYGLTSQNVGTSFGATYTGANDYPQNSNRTTYIPVKFGIRF